MSVDFVVCNKDAYMVAVIELDVSTPNKLDRQTTDTKDTKEQSIGGRRN